MAYCKRNGIFNTYTPLSLSPSPCPSTNDQVLSLNKNSSPNLNPAFCPKIFINELSPFSNNPYSILLAKVLTVSATTPDSFSALIQDAQGSTITMNVLGAISLKENSRIGVFDPMLSMAGRKLLLEAKAACIFQFPTHEEFVNVGWTEKKPPGFKSEHYLRLGEMMMELQQYQEAVDKFEIGLKIDATNLEIRTRLAQCYFLMKKFSEAVRFAREVYEESLNLDSAILLADSYLMLNQITEAHKIFDEIYKQHSGHKKVLDLQKKLETKVRKVKPYKRKIGKMNKTKLSRLKELVLVEWPRLMSAERVKERLEGLGVPVDRVTIKGKTAILFYNELETRELAREKILELAESEFMLANEPVKYPSVE